MAKKKIKYEVFLNQESASIKFATLEDVNQALQLTMALHQSCTEVHDICVYDSEGAKIVDVYTQVDNEE